MLACSLFYITQSFGAQNALNKILRKNTVSCYSDTNKTYTIPYSRVTDFYTIPFKYRTTSSQ